MKADRHPEELARLAKLRSYDILDSEAEAEFDEVVRVVSDVCGMPVSLISLVDEDRQWFKAKTGVDLTETPFEMSVCAHGILQPDILEIEDMTKDVRTIDNPLVSGDPHARFYAGAALVTDDGHPLGMLCVLDYQPRKLTQAQRDLLSVMAKLVMRQIELRKVVRNEQKAHGMVQGLLDKANTLLEQNDLLRRELEHRIKNMQAITGAIVLQTFRSAETKDQARDILTGRLAALNQAHEILTRVSWTAAPLRTVVEGALAPYRTGTGRFSIEGPECLLDAKQALSLALGLHELATNATKYGALSNERGHITIAWKIDHQAGGSRCLLEWQELGGPPVLPPTRKGFGTRLIASIDSSEASSILFPVHGVHCTLVFKIERDLSGQGENRLSLPGKKGSNA